MKVVVAAMALLLIAQGATGCDTPPITDDEVLNIMLDVVGNGAEATILSSIMDELDEGEYAFVRPVNLGVRKWYQAGAAVGKGLNVKAKSSIRNDITRGLIPFQQTPENTGRELSAGLQDTLQADINAQTEAVTGEMLDRCTQQCLAGNMPLKCTQLPIIVNRPDMQQYARMIGETRDEQLNVMFDAVGYLVPGEDCMFSTALPVVSDYDILLIGNCHGMEADRELLKSWDFYALAKASIEKYQLLEAEPRRWFDFASELDDIINSKYYAKMEPLMGLAGAATRSMVTRLQDVTEASGAVRHSSEHLNYAFPQPFGADETTVLLYKTPRSRSCFSGLTNMFRRWAGITTEPEPKAIWESVQLIQGYEQFIHMLKFMRQTGCNCLAVNYLWLHNLGDIVMNPLRLLDSLRPSRNIGSCPYWDESIPVVQDAMSWVRRYYEEHTMTWEDAIQRLGKDIDWLSTYRNG